MIIEYYQVVGIVFGFATVLLGVWHGVRLKVPPPTGFETVTYHKRKQEFEFKI